MCLKHKHSEIVPMLQALKAQGVSIGLISNCYQEEAIRIRKSDLFPYFDAVCLFIKGVIEDVAQVSRTERSGTKEEQPHSQVPT